MGDKGGDLINQMKNMNLIKEKLKKQGRRSPTLTTGFEVMGEAVDDSIKAVDDSITETFQRDKTLGKDVKMDGPPAAFGSKPQQQGSEEEDGKNKGGGFLEFFGLAGGRRRRRRKRSRKNKSKRTKRMARKSRRRSRRRRGGCAEGEIEVVGNDNIAKCMTQAEYEELQNKQSHGHTKTIQGGKRRRRKSRKSKRKSRRKSKKRRSSRRSRRRRR